MSRSPGALGIMPRRSSTTMAACDPRRRPSDASSSRAGCSASGKASRRAGRSDVADAGRVIAGSAKGIRLGAPGPRTRPLADRVKHTLFAIVEPELAGASVLDLFAGSGAAGIEALSRGAALATFVDNDAAAVATIRANVAGAAVADRAEIVRDDVVRWLGRGSSRHSFDLVVVDPPYAETELLARTLGALGEPDAPLASTVRVVAKHFWRDR